MPPSTERPRSIAELAELGNPAGLYDPRKSIREHFHLINNMRDEGYEYKTSGDVENAFITLAKAASLILDKIPNHAEYSQLNPKQKGSLADNGRTFLQMLEELKPKISDRYETWASRHPNATKEDGKRRAAAERAKWEDEKRRAAATKQELDDARRVEVDRRRLEDERRRLEFEYRKEAEATRRKEEERRRMQEERRLQEERIQQEERRKSEERRQQDDDRRRQELKERTLNTARSLAAAEHENQEQERFRQDWDESSRFSGRSNNQRPPLLVPGYQPAPAPPPVIPIVPIQTEAERRHLQRLEAERIAKQQEEWRNPPIREEEPPSQPQSARLQPNGNDSSLSRPSSHRPSPSMYLSTPSSLDVAASPSRSGYSSSTPSDGERLRMQRAADAAAAKAEEARRADAAIRETREQAKRTYAAASDRLRDDSRVMRANSFRSSSSTQTYTTAPQGAPPSSYSYGPAGPIMPENVVIPDTVVIPDNVVIPNGIGERSQSKSDGEDVAGPPKSKGEEKYRRAMTAAQAKEQRETEARAFLAMREKEKQEEPSRMNAVEPTTPEEEPTTPLDDTTQSYFSGKPTVLQAGYPPSNPPPSGALNSRDGGRSYNLRSRDPSPRPPALRDIPSYPPPSVAGSYVPPSISGSYRRHNSVTQRTPERSAIPYVTPLQDDDFLPILPLESPTRLLYPDSSDKEQDPGRNDTSSRRGKAPTRSSSYPPPITTTTPLPPGVTKPEYPPLMSSHQKQQGYVPSTNSMFTIPVYPEPPASSLLFQPAHPPPEASQQSNTYGNPQHTRSQSYGSQYGGSGSSYTNSFRPPYGTSNTQYSTYPPEAPPARTGYPDARPPRPPKEPVSPQRSSSLGLVNAGSTSPKKLRTVVLPPSTLPRFLSIAAVNTSLNKETCGLLLGKLHKDKLYVSTLLIPRQEGTSDTCSMTHEELVVQFQLDRDLTTVGWIHTHPTQSCFMSSMDLHTHASYQKMLPEAIAIVCSPKNTPNFGIFRLTDPPGLPIILNCKDERSFHPHSDIDPIYTDADSGHVQMKELDADLEIIDLR